jgi:hypothetical protein
MSPRSTGRASCVSDGKLKQIMLLRQEVLSSPGQSAAKDT